MRVHEVKSWAEFFEQIKLKNRKHELRHNERDYKVGEYLLLREFDKDDGYTGRRMTVMITSITSDDVPCAVSAYGLNTGYCILSIEVMNETNRQDSSETA